MNLSDRLRISPMLIATSLAPYEAIKISWTSDTLLKIGSKGRELSKRKLQREETPQPIRLLIEFVHSMLETATAWSLSGYVLVSHDRL